MKSKNKVLISLFLVLVMLTLTSSPVLSADVQAAYNKLPDSLLEEFNAIGNGGSLDVIVWLEDETTDKYQAMVENIPEPSFENDSLDPASYSTENISETASELSEEERLAQIEEIQNYIMQKRQIAQAVYLEDNTAIANELAESGGEIVYISRYSSLVICNVTLSEAVNMAMCNSVLKLESGNNEIRTEMSESLSMVGVDELRQSSSTQYNANGIILGMIEPEVPDESYGCFSGIEHKISKVDVANVSAGDKYAKDHASMVAAIMVGKTSGVAKGFSHLYCAPLQYGTAFYANVEALLSNGVNVINMSAGFYDNDPTDGYNSCPFNTYDTPSRWLDHIAYNHSVHFVKAAGNEGVDGVSSPGMAHNIITVGNVYDNGELDSTSSRNVLDATVAFKPDLCAPGNSINIPDAFGFKFLDRDGNEYDTEQSGGGTSFSAPHVAGTIAILCSLKPVLLVKQALVKSILLSSVATKSYYRTDTTSYIARKTDENGNAYYDYDNPILYNNYYKQYGSGVINAYNAVALANSGNYIAGTITSSEEHDSISIGNLQKGDKVSITLTFLKRVRFDSNDHSGPEDSTETFADLDLYICPAAAYVGGGCSRTTSHIKSITANNYTEKINYTAPFNGEYVICIDKYSTNDYHNIIYGVSWQVHDDTLQ